MKVQIYEGDKMNPAILGIIIGGVIGIGIGLFVDWLIFWRRK